MNYPDWTGALLVHIDTQFKKPIRGVTLNQRQKGTLPSDTVTNPRNKGHCIAITTRREIVLYKEPATDRGIAVEKESTDLKGQVPQQSKKRSKE
ncbi:hypothetical protein HAX54_046341, partial [Datura stramonium]|nr:hypothetical protein [Datura stramonium]